MREVLDLREVRFAPEDDGVLQAVAVKFNVLDTYGTSFDSRAFQTGSVRLPMLWSHQADQVIGSWSNLAVEGDELRATGKLNLEVGRAREIRAMLSAGDISGVSIGFETLKAEARKSVRHITKVRLHEISLVALPSVPGSRVTAIRSGGNGATADFIAAVKSASRAFSQETTP